VDAFDQSLTASWGPITPLGSETRQLCKGGVQVEKLSDDVALLPTLYHMRMTHNEWNVHVCVKCRVFSCDRGKVNGISG